ncbi:MAG: HAD family phosphatase [Lachnospiraceae bacterium]|nr:HAD family phosphatase [Lachnospiraceae bacterium]
MIKNIIFDMGNVLIRFIPQVFLERYNLTVDDAKLLLKTVFLTEEWCWLDDGRLDEPEFYDIIKDRVPERLREVAKNLIMHWDDPIMDMPGMWELAGDLKKKGYGIYLLSNASRRQHEYWPRIKASEFFDGTLISADVKLVKPDRRIYETLYEKFGLKPEECFFIDDAPANIEGAKKTGMDGFLFNFNADALRDELVKRNIL